jgi:WhiB family transcriptional regulator, redox-sensing transcriptional regulator
VAAEPSTIFTEGERPQPVGRDEGKTSLSESRPAARRLNLVPVNSNLRAATEGDRAWVSKALCKSADPDELFVRGAAQRKAAVICRHCPVMQQCAADALDNQVEYGVWGGLTERQRRALLKENPGVVSWAEFLEKRSNRSIG